MDSTEARAAVLLGEWSFVQISRETLYDGRRLRADREAVSLSLRELARRLGISASYLSDLERGNRRLTEDVARPASLEIAREAG